MDHENFSSDHLTEFWRRYAASYDRILPLAPFYQNAVARHVATILAHRAHCVLDLGCATGNVAVPVAFAGVDVVALDSSQAMIDRASAKAVGFDVDRRIRFMVHDAHEAQYEEPFDIVTVLLALFCMSDARKVLESAVAALKPGGLILFTEPTRAFQEAPLLEFAHHIIFTQLKRHELDGDWEVVASAGHTLGSLIRNAASGAASSSSIRADELPTELARLGCHVIASQDSHLGQCRFLVACKA